MPHIIPESFNIDGAKVVINVRSGGVCTGATVEIDSAAALAIMSLVRHSLAIHPAAPAAPADHGDDAAVEAMFRAWMNCEKSEKESMRGVLAAINRGEVPGVWYNQEIAKERDALKAEVERLRARVRSINESMDHHAKTADAKAERWMEESARLAAEVESLKAAADPDALTIVRAQAAADYQTEIRCLRAMVCDAQAAERAFADACSPDKTKALLMGEFGLHWNCIKAVQAAILEQARLNMGWRCAGCGSADHILTLRDRGHVSCCLKRQLELPARRPS
ncbi:MAG: hypothetical protein RLZZ524_2920 [Pseudomonadota bacterium]|jgi:hypothetical protein